MLNQLNQFPTATSTPGITGLTFLRIASPRVGKVPPCRLPTRGNAILRVPFPRVDADMVYLLLEDSIIIIGYLLTLHANPTWYPRKVVPGPQVLN